MRGFFIVLGILIILPIALFLSIGKDIFAILYEFSTFLYGKDLALHLYGWNGVNFENTSNYIPNGFILYFFTLLTVILFYYLIDSVSFSRMWHWGLIWILNAVVAYFLSFYFFSYLDFSNGEIASDIAGLIEVPNLHLWGLTNAIYSLVLFIIFSFSLRWWSTNCSTTPIPR